MVYDAIVRLAGHCTAEEITVELHKSKPAFARSTVYRALEALTASGSVYAAHLGDGPTHYELASGDHHHAVCQVCGGVMHIQEEAITSGRFARRSWWSECAIHAHAIRGAR
jgi:Fe2+ or Zn2+ uptake regulation protein